MSWLETVGIQIFENIKWLTVTKSDNPGQIVISIILNSYSPTMLNNTQVQMYWKVPQTIIVDSYFILFIPVVFPGLRLPLPRPCHIRVCESKAA